MNKYLESELNMANDHIQTLKGKRRLPLVSVLFIVYYSERSHFISTASSFEELMAQFQVRLFRHYNIWGAPLYDPNEMEAFEPALFTQIINSIFNTGMIKDRQETQRKRTVAIMHILAYILAGINDITSFIISTFYSACSTCLSY